LTNKDPQFQNLLLWPLYGEFPIWSSEGLSDPLRSRDRDPELIGPLIEWKVLLGVQTFVDVRDLGIRIHPQVGQFLVHPIRLLIISSIPPCTQNQATVSTIPLLSYDFSMVSLRNSPFVGWVLLYEISTTRNGTNSLLWGSFSTVDPVFTWDHWVSRVFHVIRPSLRSLSLTQLRGKGLSSGNSLGVNSPFLHIRIHLYVYFAAS